MRHLFTHNAVGPWWRPATGLALLSLLVGCAGGTSPTNPADPGNDQNPSPEYDPYQAVTEGRWDTDPPLKSYGDREGAAPRTQTAPAAYATRNWKAVILTCSAEEVEAANYLKAKSAVRYPKVAITIVNVPGITPDTGTDSGTVSKTALANGVAAALAGYPRFDMIQVMHQFPHHVTWGSGSPPGAGCGLGTQFGDRWSVESVLMTGFDANTLADSPASFNSFANACPMPWFTGGWYSSQNDRFDYMVARLEGRDLAQVKQKIDQACAPASVARPGVVVDGPGKKGPANNNQSGGANIQTYWEHIWLSDALFEVKGKGTKYGFPTMVDMTGYVGDSNNTNKDECSEMPAAAFAYQTSSTFPVGYLVSYGRHSNGDGSCGPAFSGASIYTNLQWAPRGVVFVGESHTAYSLAGSNFGSTRLNDWIDLPAAGVIAFKNEPCLTGIYHDNFADMYVGRNATFAEAAIGSFQFLKSIDCPFGVAWMTLRDLP